MFSVEDLSKNSSEAAFTAAEGTLAENIITSEAHEAKSQSCYGNEESSRDFPLPKNPQKVAESEDTNMISGNQHELAMMAQDQALKSNNFPILNSENATYDDTKIPEVVKRRRKYKDKQFSFSALGAAKKKNVTTEHNGGVRIDGNLEKSHMARERKKSKYLSYPYIDPMDETNAGKNETKEVSNLKTETDKAKIMNLTSAEMLSKLCLTAQSGSFSMERKYSGPVKSFFSYFRRFSFLKLEDDSSQDLYESELHIRRAKESSNCTSPEEQNDEDLMEYPTSSNGNVKKFRGSADKTSTDIGFSYPLKNCLNGSMEMGSPGTVPGASKSVTVDKKRKGKTVSGIDKANPIKSMTVDKKRKGKTVSGIDKSNPIKSVTVDKQRKGKMVSGINEANPIKSVTVGKQRKGKTVSGINEANPINRLLDSNANITTSSAEESKLTGYVAASANLEENSIKMGNPCTTSNPGLSGISGNRVTFVQLLNDVQAGAPNLFQSIVQENKAGVQSSFISNSRQSEAEENQVESASSGKNCSPEAECVPPGFIPQHKEVGEKLKMEALNVSNNKVAVSAPDGNVIVAESNSIRNYKQIASPHSFPARKRKGRKRKVEALNIPSDETGVSSQNMNDIESPLSKEKPIKRRKQRNLQNKSAAILLNFTSGFSVPSIESILEAFSGYGIINKSETRYVNDSAAQVVFVQSANAKEAFQSLKTNNPFGPVLGNYLLQPLSAATTENNNKLQIHHSFPEMNGINVLPAPPGMNSKDGGESPNLVFIKQKLEMMTSMLEKAGSNLSAEMRAKLETEIRSFTEKVNSMVGSSSSS